MGPPGRDLIWSSSDGYVATTVEVSQLPARGILSCFVAARDDPPVI